jgi:hypothetical protein
MEISLWQAAAHMVLEAWSSQRPGLVAVIIGLDVLAVSSFMCRLIEFMCEINATHKKSILIYGASRITTQARFCRRAGISARFYDKISGISVLQGNGRWRN